MVKTHNKEQKDEDSGGWFSARMRKVIAREALDMVSSAKKRWGKRAVKPIYKGKKISVSSTVAQLQENETTKFDAWFHLHSIGNHTIFDIPIKLHKHFNKWNKKGKRLNAYTITPTYVQFCFEIETDSKKTTGDYVGIDTGINCLATASSGNYYGKQIKQKILNIKNKQHGSKRQQKARRALKQYIDEIVKEIFVQENLQTIVVEKLKNITNKTRSRKLNATTRYFIGSWNYRYWLNRLQQKTEENRVCFRSVPAYNTSVECSKCGHTDKNQRKGQDFNCNQCGYAGCADYNASINILNRWFRGAYGPSCKP